jgi:hypothetical protein
MGLRHRIMMIVSICFLLCVGSYFIITNIFKNIESQLFEKCRIEAKIAARTMIELMDLMITRNVLTEAALFDTNYVEIKGTSPKKYTTKYDKIFDTIIQKHEDIFVMNDDDLVYALLVDRNGYAPTHNSTYSKPSTSDGLYNLKFNRSKRKFDDEVGLKAARYNGNGLMEQLYPRDTGETIWDIAVPINIKGKHWGAFRIGVSFNRINDIKVQMLFIVVMTIFVIVCVTLLMLFMVIPRKFLSSDITDQRR